MQALLKGSLLSLTLFVSPLISPLLADDAASGFFLESLPYPSQGLTATLEDGSILGFDGTTLEHFDSNGLQLATLATLPAPVFGSFLKLSPDLAFAVLGESSQGNLYRIELDGSGYSLIGSLAFNYDASFESPSSLIVSAATAGFGLGNDLVRVDLPSGATQFLAHLAGASGPLVVDLAGNLYYGTTSAAFPAPAGSSEILRFDAALLDGSMLLDESHASVISAGFDNATALAFDALHGDLFLAEVNGNLNVNQIRRVGASPSLSPVLLSGTPGEFLSNLEFHEGDGQSKMRAFQEFRGGQLFYSTTDFFSSFERRRITPQRAELVLSGPGTQGLGQVDLNITGAQPNGSVLLFYGPAAQVINPEYAVNLQALDFPLLFGVNPTGVRVVAGMLVLDSNGAGQLSLHNPSGQTGIFAVQGLHGSNPGFRGTTYLATL